MTEKRVLTTKEAAQFLGISTDKFRLLRKNKAFPVKPVPYCKSRYDVKALEKYLDNETGGKKETDQDRYNELVMKRLGHGKNPRQIPAHS